MRSYPVKENPIGSARSFGINTQTDRQTFCYFIIRIENGALTNLLKKKHQSTKTFTFRLSGLLLRSRLRYGNCAGLVSTSAPLISLVSSLSGTNIWINDKLMYILYDDAQNFPFCGLQLVVETFGYSTWWINQSNFTKVPKVIKPTNKKRYCMTLGTSVINSPMSPLSLIWSAIRILTQGGRGHWAVYTLVPKVF